MVYGITADKKSEVLLGYVNQQLMDASGRLMSGRQALRLWALPDGKVQENELFFLTAVRLILVETFWFPGFHILSFRFCFTGSFVGEHGV